MSPYLQRLYDAAGGAAVALEARPAQLSSSPLLAVDQRLASPAYVASFLLGLPGQADQDTDAVPSPEPDLLTFPDQLRRDAAPAPGERSHRIPVPFHAPPARPQPTAAEPVATRPGRIAAPEPAARPPAGQRQIAGIPAPVPDAKATPAPAEPAEPAEPALPATETQHAPAVEVTQRADPATPRLVDTQREQRVVEPVRPQPRDRLRAVPERPPRPEHELQRPDAPTAPSPIRPAPAQAVEPLPPPPAPAATGSADLADQVNRLVREAMAANGTRRNAIREVPEGSAEDPAGTASPARTAEAMSVIGPLDRPARASTLYGLRLR